MSLIQLGDRQADWVTRARLVFPWVSLDSEKSYLFFLDQAAPKQETTNQYLVVIPEIRENGAIYQTALDCKYFPGLTPMVFAVGYPKTDVFDKADVRITLLPKEFKKGSATAKQLEIELSYDDKEADKLSFPFA